MNSFHIIDQHIFLVFLLHDQDSTFDAQTVIIADSSDEKRILVDKVLGGDQIVLCADLGYFADDASVEFFDI